MPMSTYKIEILWDASPLWGHILLNAIEQYFSADEFRIVTGDTIAEHGVRAKLLLVPGGSARHKALALGEKGQKAIQDFVHSGGIYMGFCGGAGLALKEHLGLCPWQRNSFTNKFQHVISGHIHSEIWKDGKVVKNISLPVWWPGRFSEEAGDVEVLARYVEASDDLYVADLPIRALPEDTMEDWQNLYGVSVCPSFLKGQAAIVRGKYGKGQYILSYSHLETPESPDANTLFMEILNGLGFTIQNSAMRNSSMRNSSDENLATKNPFVENPFSRMKEKKCQSFFVDLRKEFSLLLNLAEELSFLFPRNTWLYGWRSSIPGSQLNALNLSLEYACMAFYGDTRQAYLETHAKEIISQMEIFIQGAKSWFLARRLSETLGANFSDQDSEQELVPRKALISQRNDLFGPPMSGGGLCGLLQKHLDNYLLLES